ncbi:aspartate kinase, partial [Staphylococcus epidermidis]
VLNGINYQDKKKEIIQRYADIVEDLKMDDEILTTIDETLELYISQLSDKPSRLYDALVSCGEDFNAQLIANYNNNQGIPTRYI